MVALTAALLSRRASSSWPALSPAAALMPTLVQDEDGLRVALDSMRQLATDTRSNKEQRATTRPRRGLPVKLGRDGRLTVLLIGSDWRPDSLGERLDVLMVATIDPLTGKAAVVSIPRDMAGIPFAGGGSSGGMRVNSIYFIRYRDPSLPHAALDRAGLKRFSEDIGALLGHGDRLLGADPLRDLRAPHQRARRRRLDVDEEVLDTSYHHGSSRGRVVPGGHGLQAQGRPQVQAQAHASATRRSSTRARATAPWAASYNNDWRRAERQQDIVRAAVKDVLEDRGAGIGLLGTLLRVRDLIETNIPKTVEAAGQLYALLEKLKLPASNMKVLAPATWAGSRRGRHHQAQPRHHPPLGGRPLLPGRARSALATEPTGATSA